MSRNDSSLSPHLPIPYGKQSIDDSDIQAVMNVLQSDYLTTGPLIEQFETHVAEQAGTQYAVVFNSGTSALHAAYAIAGLGAGDQVITTPMTFAATANAVLYTGAAPTFADIRSDDGLLDLSSVKQKMNPSVKAVTVVDYAGKPCDMLAYRQWADEEGLVLIEDACHAFGATYLHKPVGAYADMTVFSFHPVKPITTAEGGAVVTNDTHYYEALQSFRSHGIVRTKEKLQENHGPWYYEMQTLGFNYRLTDLQCALGLSQIQKLPHFLNKRRSIAEKYHRMLQDLNEHLDCPNSDSLQDSGWHLFVIQVKQGPITRKACFEYLQSKGIHVQVHYLPVYLHPYYQNLGYAKGLCPEAEQFYNRIISLPIYPDMTDDQIQYVSDQLHAFFQLTD